MEGEQSRLIRIIKSRGMAHSNQVLATPTAIRRSPNPERRVIGDLSVTEQVLKGLDIPRSVKPAAGAVESTTRNEPPEVQRG